MCNITYTSLVFDETSQTITLKGTADCNSITAEVVSPHFTIGKTVGVSASGDWTIVYSGNDLLASTQEMKGRCGIGCKIDAFCTQDPNCKKHNQLLFECVTTEKCPTIELELTNVSNNCVNGKKTATFKVTVINPVNPSVYEIVLGDGTDDTIVFNPAQNPFTITHDYSGGNYSVVVNSILPENCPTSNVVKFPILCEDNCPNVQLELVSVSDCNVDGTRIATFRINVTNAPSSTCVYEIDYGDGSDGNISFNSATVNPIVKTHTYSSGNYSAIVNSFIPDGCPSSNTVLVPIPECKHDCPNDIKFEVIANNGNRFSVVDNDGIFEAVANNLLHQQVTCFNSGSYTLRVTSPSGQGLSFVWREDENPPIENNSRDFPFQLSANENKSITVIVKKDGCIDLAETVNIHECSGDSNRVNCEFTEAFGPCVNGQQIITRTIITPASNGGRPCPPRSETVSCPTPPPTICDLCCIWNWINIIFFIATSIFILVTFCMLEATAVSAILALASGGTLAAVTAALSVTNVVMLWICVGLIIAGLISFILWLIFCVFNKPNACSLLSTLMIALAGITASSLALLILLLALQRFGCAAGALINLGWFGFILSIATLVYTAMGCFNRNSN
ncbi:MAG: hypothetical protein SGI96_22185 [Bacteroidota bacterium]|nr:hypothetical protein [Bacteroidota bacterium]